MQIFKSVYKHNNFRQNYSNFNITVHVKNNCTCTCMLSHIWLCNPVDCRLPGSSVHGISQARMLEWVAISISRRSSWPRDWTSISCNTGRFFTTEPPGWCFSGWLNPAIFLGICLIDGKDHAFPSSVKLGSLQPSPAALCFCSAI